MIKIENFEVMGWEHAIRGMRNPMNSWAKSDSSFKETTTCDYLDENDQIKQMTVSFDALNIGPNDWGLMKRLAEAGPVHGKFRRMITVYVDITAPLYFWKEFDTYKIGTTANSCSTMHKIQAKEFTLDDFSHEHLISGDVGPQVECEHCNLFNDMSAINILELTVDALNHYRGLYQLTKDKKYWWQMIQLLPSSYNQKRTVMLNYEVLAGMYEYRKNHKLDEWREFCKWIETLPFFELITGCISFNPNLEQKTKEE